MNMELNEILNRLSDKDNVISEEYLESINVDYWINNGDISDSLLSDFLKLLFTKLATQSRVIRHSVERLKFGDWKTYNKHEGL